MSALNLAVLYVSYVLALTSAVWVAFELRAYFVHKKLLLVSPSSEPLELTPVEILAEFEATAAQPRLA